jgi:hypothetical protein
MELVAKQKEIILADVVRVSLPRQRRFSATVWVKHRIVDLKIDAISRLCRILRGFPSRYVDIGDQEKGDSSTKVCICFTLLLRSHSPNFSQIRVSRPYALPLLPLTAPDSTVPTSTASLDFC